MLLNEIPKGTNILICIFIIVSTKQQFGEGWAIGPADYHFSIENDLGDGVLNVHCRSNSDDLGLVRLPVHSNYTHSLRTQMFKDIRYYCELSVSGSLQKTFDTFKDVIEFVDNQCGGRHCFWKASDHGIFLYQIQKKQYIKKYDWDTTPPDDENPNEDPNEDPNEND